MVIYYMMNEDDVWEVLCQLWSSIGLDVGVVVDLLKFDVMGLLYLWSFGIFLRILVCYVCEFGDFSFEEVICKMIFWLVMCMWLKDWGVFEVGVWVDIVVFDLDIIQDCVMWDELMFFLMGIDWVIVNGVVVVEEGEYIGVKFGWVVCGQGVCSEQVLWVVVLSCLWEWFVFYVLMDYMQFEKWCYEMK